MVRRDVLLGITQADAKQPERQITPGYAMRGASKSMLFVHRRAGSRGGES